MKRRFYAIMLIALMLLTSLSSMAFAADLVENWLNESHKGVYAGDNFTDIYSFEPLFNPLGLEYDLNDPTDDFSFWHLIDSSKGSQYAYVWFTTGSGELVNWKVGPIKNNQHFAIITPSDWKLANGVSFSTSSGNFVLSHSGRHQASAGTVKVQAQVSSFYNEITPHAYYERPIDQYYERPIDKYYERIVDEYYERTIDEYYERTVDEYFERTIDEFYERTIDEYFERDVFNYFQRDAQKYLIPVFEKKINEVKGTLVTRLNYDSKSRPINGGAFNNGHTYVEINVAQAMSEDGIWLQIADSSKQNGKKTSDQFNIPIDYYYNVRIVDGQLIISFPDDLAYVNVGAYVAVNPKGFPGNAPSHQSGGVSVALPKNYGDTILLYTHIDGLGWYDTDGEGEYVYRFVEWRYDEARTEYGEYAFLRTEKGEYELVKRVAGDWVLVDRMEGEWQLVDTIKGDWTLADRVEGEYELVDKKLGEYYWVKDVPGEYVLVNSVPGKYVKVKSDSSSRRVDVAYTGSMSLTVDGEAKPLNTAFSLSAGTHSFVLSGEGFEAITKSVNIVSGDNGTIVFGPIEVQLADVTLSVVEHHKDVAGEEFFSDVTGQRFDSDKIVKHHSDLPATRHEKDLPATRHEKDLPATRHEKDLEATRHEKDRDPVRIDIEEYNFLEDIKLGDEIDAFGPYALRLN